MSKSIEALVKTLNETVEEFESYLYDLDQNRQALCNGLAQDLADENISPLDRNLKADVQPDRPKYQAFRQISSETYEKCQNESALTDAMIAAMEQQCRAAAKEALLEFHGIFQQYRTILLAITQPFPKRGIRFTTCMTADERIHDVLNGIPQRSLNSTIEMLWEHIETRPQPLSEALSVYDTYVTTGTLKEISLDRLTNPVLKAIIKLLLSGQNAMSKECHSHLQEIAHHEFVLHHYVPKEVGTALNIPLAMALLQSMKERCMECMGMFIDKPSNDNQTALVKAWKDYLFELSALYTKVMTYAENQLQLPLLQEIEEDQRNNTLRETIHKMLDEKTNIYQSLKKLEPSKFSDEDHATFIKYFKKTYPRVADAMKNISMTTMFSIAYDIYKSAASDQLPQKQIASGSHSQEISTRNAGEISLKKAADSLKEKSGLNPLTSQEKEAFDKTLEAYDDFLKTGKTGECEPFRGFFSKFF